VTLRMGMLIVALGAVGRVVAAAVITFDTSQGYQNGDIGNQTDSFSNKWAWSGSTMVITNASARVSRRGVSTTAYYNATFTPGAAYWEAAPHQR